MKLRSHICAQLGKSLCGILFAIVVLSGCTKSSDRSNQRPTVAFLGSLSGGYGDFGKRTLHGIQLAFSEQEDVQLKVFDSASRAETAIKLLNDIAADPNIVAVVGEISSELSLTIAPVAQKLKIPLISPTATNPEIAKVVDFVFQLCFVDPFQGYVMAKFAKDHLNLKRVAILKDFNSDYSSGLAQFFTSHFTELSGKVVIDEIYRTGDRDFKQQIENIRKHKPEAIFVPGYYKEVAQIARQVRSLGMKATLLGGDGWDSAKLFKIARDAVNGSYFVNHFTSEEKQTVISDFVKSYRKMFNNEPDGLSARGYDAAKAVLSALEASKDNLDRSTLRDAVRKLRDLQGVTGKTQVGSDRVASRPAVVLRVDGPLNKFVTKIHPPQKNQ